MMMTRASVARILVVAGLVALTLVYLSPVAFQGRIPADRDNLCFYFPLLTVFQWDGIPTWNPYELSGSSLVANPQTALLYPPNWVLPFVPWAVGYALTTLAHYVWAGLGAYLLGRRLGIGRLPAFFAAVTFLLGGYLQCRLLVRPLLLSAAWMPWAMALFLGALRGGSPLGALLAGVAAAMSFLPGMYHNGAATLVLFAAATPLVPLPRAGTRAAAVLRRAGLLLLAAAVGLGLAAGSISPAAELLPHTVRSRFDYEAASSSSVAVQDLPRVFLGFPRDPVTAEWNFFEKNAFPGWVGLPLALFALVRLGRRRGILPRGAKRGVLLLLLLFAAGLAVSLGSNTPVHRFLFELPGGRFFNNPSRALVLCFLSLAMLAGIGLEECDQLVCRWRRPRVLVVFGLLALQVGLLFLYRGFLRVGFAVPPYASKAPHIEFLSSAREEGARVMAYDPLRVVAGDFWPLHWPRFRNMLEPKIATIDRIEDVAGYDPLHLTRYGEALRALAGQSPGRLAWRDVDPALPVPRLLDLLSVRYVLGEVHDRRVLSEKIELAGIEERWFDLAENLGPCRSIRIQASLTGALRVPQGTKVATLWVSGRDRNGTRTALAVPLRAGIEVADALAGSSPRCDHHRIDVYRRWPVLLDGRAAVVETYETRIPLPEPLTPERVRVAHFNPDGAMVLWSAAFEQVAPKIPFERVFEEGPFRVYRNRGALPRARLVFHAEVLPGFERVLARVTDPAWNPANSAVVEDANVAEGVSGGEGTVDWIERGREVAELDAELTRSGILVLAEVHYPGWKAWIDGNRVPIFPANGFLRAVAVPQGRHRIRLVYSPDGFFLGLWVVLATAGGVLLFLVFLWWSRQRELATLASGGPTPMAKKVLLVEDEPDTRVVLMESLQYYGFEVVTAKDGMEALQKLERTIPDIILMDMNLPVLSGWEAVQMIKADQRLKEVPVVALTASTAVTDEARAFRLGCVDFIPKPCEPKDVAARIERALEKQRRI